MPPYALGYRPDTPSLRDLRASERLELTPPPPAFSLEHLVLDILDQKSLSSCVANAVMQAIRMSHIAQGFGPPLGNRLGSRLLAYFFSRAFHHETGVDAGTFFRTTFQANERFGFVPEDLWPYIEANVNVMPATEAVRSAYDQITTEYARIDSLGSRRVDDVKRAIAQGYPVVFGTDVGNEIFSWKGGDAPLDPPVKDIAGGHGLVLTSYNEKDVVRGPNSWGVKWGDAGWFEFTADYIANDCTRDLWMVKRMPRYSV